MYPWYHCATLCAALILPVAATGCTPSPLSDSGWPEPRPLGAQLDTYQPTQLSNPSADSSPPQVTQAQGELTLRRAMALTLLQSPQLAAFALDVRAAEARVVQAGLWSNPEVEFEIDEFAGSGDFSGADAAEFTLSLAQTFPIGNDIHRRRELAQQQAQLTGWDYEATRIDLLTQLTKRYVAVLANQQSLAVALEELTLAQAVLTTTTKRVEAGATPRVELIRARVPVAQAQVQTRRSQRRLQAARYQLALMWNQNQPTFDTVVGDFEQIHPPPEPSTLANLINQNPHVAKWATQISTHRAEAALAKAQALPDVTGQLGVKRLNESDDTALVVSISLPLPLFDRHQGDILAARWGEAAARQRQRQAELRLAQQLSEAWTQLADAYDEATVLTEDALPPALEAFEVTRRAFELGDVAFIDVLDAERTLVELRRQRVAALANYHTAVAEIESLIGQPLHSLATSDINEQPSSNHQDRTQ